MTATLTPDRLRDDLQALCADPDSRRVLADQVRELTQHPTALADPSVERWASDAAFELWPDYKRLDMDVRLGAVAASARVRAALAAEEGR